MNTACHVTTSENIGDRVSCPLDYFPEFGHFERLDIGQDWPSDANIIFGGGGLLSGNMDEHGWSTGVLLERFSTIAKRKDRKLIAWGIGSNVEGGTSVEYSNWLNRFDLIGLRDFGNPWHYVPCPSCLHPAFDSSVVTKGIGVVIYEHADHPILDIPIDRRLNNTKLKSEMFSVIEFIANAEVVITSAYHGAYWASLLGKKVAIYRPEYSRFYGFKHPIPFCDASNWETVVEAASTAVGLLEECRAANVSFKDWVMKELNG